MGRKVTILLFIVVMILFSPCLRGQKVALVLSGGGSRGAAHIGVIKALEENNIPIDFIAGTSIGAVIGAMYASGYSPEEMEALITSEEFARWASGKIQDKYIYYFLQPQPNGSWANFKFNLKKRLTASLPTNIISPFEMDFAMMQILGRPSATAKNNFDSLMIPFRCVAAYIDSSKAMVLRDGDLGTAVRASMTFPFYFKPIEINERLVFDGGMYNNFPADVALEDFKPDMIIGSKVSGNFQNPDASDILSQLETMLMAKTNYSVILPNGVLIEPKLDKVSLLDFSHSEAFIDSGYQATLKKIPEIRKSVTRSVSPEEVALKRMQFHARWQDMIFDSISILGLKKSQSAYVRVMLKHSSKYISAEAIKKAYFRLIADDKIKSIFPVATYEPGTGYYNLHLNIVPTDNFGIQVGGNISSSGSNQGFIELNYKFMGPKVLKLKANAYFGRFYNSIQAGVRMEFPSRLPFILEADYTYNLKDFFKISTYFFQDKTPSFLIESEQLTSLRTSIPVTNKGKLATSFDYAYMHDRYYQNNSFTRLDTADVTNFELFTPGIEFELNSLNRKQFASSGILLNLSVNYINGRETNIPGTHTFERENFVNYHDWFQLRLLYQNYFQRLGRMKLGIYFEGMLSNQGFFRNYTSSLLFAPAFQPVPESKALFLPAYRSYSYAAVGLQNVISLLKNVDLRLEAYYFQPYRQINAAPDGFTPEYGLPFNNRYLMASTALVYHSILGPLSVSLNYYERLEERVSFALNFGYILFNRKAIH